MVASSSETTDIDLDDLAEGKSSDDLSKFRSRKSKSSVSRLAISLIIVAVLLFLSSIGVWFTNIFLNASIKDKGEYTSIESFVIEKGVSMLDWYRHQFHKKSKGNINTTSTDIDTKKDTVKKYINDNTILFYDRKESRNTWVSKKMSDIKSVDKTLKEYQELISKYKYIPEDIEEFIEDNKMIDILKVVEAIRIYVLGKVYDRIHFPDAVIDEDTWSDMVLYGEKGVEDYVQNCILNYMTENCERNAKDHDFGDKLAEIIEKKSGSLNSSEMSNKIKELQAAYKKAYDDSNDTDDKLKPIQMLFNNFNPTEGTLTFTLQIRLLDNYLSDDVNHTVIVTDIINLLRESHLILGKNIKVNTINTEKRKLKIGPVTNIVYETNFNFVIDLQENVQKEIYDYIDR